MPMIFCYFAYLFITLTLSKVLSLGKVQNPLAFHSLIRIFAHRERLDDHLQ